MNDPYVHGHCDGMNFSFRWHHAHLFWYRCHACATYFSRPARDRMKAKTRAFGRAYSTGRKRIVEAAERFKDVGISAEEAAETFRRFGEVFMDFNAIERRMIDDQR